MVFVADGYFFPMGICSRWVFVSDGYLFPVGICSRQEFILKVWTVDHMQRVVEIQFKCLYEHDSSASEHKTFQPHMIQSTQLKINFSFANWAETNKYVIVTNVPHEPLNKTSFINRIYMFSSSF